VVHISTLALDVDFLQVVAVQQTRQLAVDPDLIDRLRVAHQSVLIVTFEDPDLESRYAERDFDGVQGSAPDSQLQVCVFRIASGKTVEEDEVE
jgi:hypothetical protein